MRRGDITKAILERLADAGKMILDAFLPPQYPEAKLSRIILGLDHSRAARKAAKHSLSSMLSHLKKQGLVETVGLKKRPLWSITAKGRRILKAADAKSDTPDYGILPEDGTVRIVAFDVPEKHRAKRIWLRTALVACGYDALQRSVFVGHRPLPENIIQEIEKRKMDQYVHIMSIKEKGTLPRTGKTKK